MLSKNKIKFINSLKKKKNRIKKGCFIAEGEKIIFELLGDSTYKITELFAIESFLSKLTSQQKDTIDELHAITEEELDKVSDLKNPNKTIAVVKIPEYTLELEEVKNSLCLVLDNINDPGNLGTIIRTADWFGINHIFCSEDSVDLYNPKVIQSTMGSFMRIKLFYKNLETFLPKFRGIKGFQTYGCFLEGQNIYSAPLLDKGFIVMGSESHGISDNLENYIHQKLYIPRFMRDDKHSPAESLNISVATGIVCSEFRRTLTK